MKKVVSTVAALGLVAGMACTASAMEFSVKGSYQLVGAAQNNANGATQGVDVVDNFDVNVGTGMYNVGNVTTQNTGVAVPAVMGTLTTLVATTTGPGTAFIKTYKTNQVLVAAGVTTTTATIGQARTHIKAQQKGTDAFYFHSFKLEPTLKVNDNVSVKADVRMADRDVWGLDDTRDGGATLTGVTTSSGRVIDVRQIYMEYMSPIGKFRVGRVPVAAWGSAFLDNASQGNRIQFWPKMGDNSPIDVCLFTQKIAENDAAGIQSDSDTDGYYAGVGYKADFGKITAAYFQVRNAGNAAETLTQHNIWVHAKLKFSNLAIEAELQRLTGDDAIVGNLVTDRDGWALYGNAKMNMGKFSIGGLGFWATGDGDGAADNENSATLAMLGGTGDDFNPYLILTGDWTGLLNTDKANQLNAYGLGQAGVKSIGLTADMAASDKLSLNAVLGFAWADDTDAVAAALTAQMGKPVGVDDDYGMEIDLNASYKLLDNLSYSVHFGYFDSGDYFKFGDAKASVNSITFMANALTMSF